MSRDFWATDRAAAVGYCREKFPENVKLTMLIADEVLCDSFCFRDHWEMERTQVPVTFPSIAEINWVDTPNGDSEWICAMSRHTFFVNLAKAYRYTGEEKYAAKFSAILDSWIDRNPLCDEAKPTSWRSLDVGIRCENWIRSLLLLEDHISPKLLEKANACLTLHGEYLVERSFAIQRLSNWGILQDTGLFLLGIWLDRKDFRDIASVRLCDEARLQIMSDGTHWEESPMYHCEVLRCLMENLIVAKRNGFEFPEDYVRRVHDMCTALARWLAPSGRVICQSDSDDTDARDIIAAGAIVFSDSYLKFVAGDALFEENIWDFGTTAVDSYAKIPGAAPDCPSFALTDSGNYMLRENNSKDSAFLHMHCGTLGSGHGHADLLHVDISAYGEDILIDSGRYTYVDSPMRRHLKLPAAHNTTRVDGKDFCEYKNSWAYQSLAEPIKGEYKFTEAADYISGAHLGYFASGVFVKREVVYLRPKLYIISDSFFTEGEHSYERNFHLGDGESQLSGNLLTWQGNRASMAMLCLNADSLAMGRAPYSKEYNKLEEGDLLTATSHCKGGSHLITVIAVGENGKIPSITAENFPLTTVRLTQSITPAVGGAVRITLDCEEYTVLFCNGDVISEVDLISDGRGHDGYGKVIAFTPKHPEGFTLAY